MGHIINYIVADKNKSKRSILNTIREEVEYEDYREGGSYHENMTWHDKTVYADEEKAREAIEKFDDGWYSDHAVLFHDTSNSENATTKRLEKQIKDTINKLNDYIADNHVKNRSSAFIGCPECGSKLSRKYLQTTDRCPLCNRDLRSETVLARIKNYQKKKADLELKLVGEKKRIGTNAPIKWLIKYEYHV